ncbi:MAG: 4a-hydroxytetrahydrobiopterin dehydratase [Candidatus Pacearchaeota archaeon]
MTSSDLVLLSVAQINENLGKLSDWTLEDKGKMIVRNFKFKDFKEAVSFVNNVAEIAEHENHHPDINVHSYNKVRISLSTHSSGGLTQKDFDVAKKIEDINKDKS